MNQSIDAGVNEASESLSLDQLDPETDTETNPEVDPETDTEVEPEVVSDEAVTEVVLDSCRIFLEAEVCSKKVTGFIAALWSCRSVFGDVTEAKKNLLEAKAISQEDYQPMREEFHKRKKICKGKKSFLSEDQFKCFQSLTIESTNALIDHFNCRELNFN